MAQALAPLPRRSSVTAFPIVILLAILLGFLPASPRSEELQADTAEALQSLLIPVHQSAAAGDYARALENLNGVASEVAAHAAAGGISVARQQKILGALELVRADLENLIRQAAEAAAVQASADTQNGAAGQTQANPAPTAPLPAPAPAPVPAPQPQAEPDEDAEEPKSEPGDKPGKGNDNGARGNGKGK
ncbi:hypothetical protein F8G81_05580 [Arthrobacter sp. CDRTa11]|uniref:hypothetical protein n=1 Tax=Arthrobacter sp. CDRTa11 TaxID=2651199 RepID=UPI002265ADFC|nr:hypothetical protein [Arthrobacter sp. CDRTa11]UZX02147.1 hypothetical protein F8G81_05580 [Arthrobacter sp. CDRTa11]